VPGSVEPRPQAVLSRALLLGQHALFAILLLVAWARAAGQRPWFEVVAAALGALYAALALAEHRRPAQRSLARGVLVLLLLAWLASVTLTPDFAWLAFPLFFAVLRLVPGPIGLPVIALMVVAVVWSHARMTGWTDVGLATIIGPTVGAVVSVGMTHAYRMLLGENAARQQLVDELTAAKADLEATHEALAESRRQAGALEERSRLSRDIHDTLAQGFSSIVLLTRAARAAHADIPNLLDRIEDQAATSLADARTVIAGLTTHGLAQEGALPAALGRLVASVGELSGIRATCEVEGAERPLPRAHEVALLRLAQGALANVATHSRASRVDVSLSITEDTTHPDIVDDGIGFDPNRIGVREDGSGYGLRSMRERMAALGGQLTIESTLGGGTAVAARLPVEAGA